MRIEILGSARDDLVAGFRFYERQLPGLGSQFLETLFTDIDSLRQHAGIHLCTEYGFRMLASRFPYAIYYRTDAGVVRVNAILDCRRNPRWILDRLKRRN